MRPVSALAARLKASVMLLTGSGVPLMLGGYVLTLGIGRGRPEASFRRARRAFSLLALVGGLSLLLLHRDSFVSGYDWDVRGTVHLGSLGKAYLSYLLVGIVLMGYNIECTYRTASSSVRHLLRPPFLALFGLLGFLTFILTSGLLYSSLGLGKLVALCFPAACANVAVAYGLMRRALIDAAAVYPQEIINGYCPIAREEMFRSGSTPKVVLRPDGACSTCRAPRTRSTMRVLIIASFRLTGSLITRPCRLGSA